eukprot:880906-Prymnesium_polylepis.1
MDMSGTERQRASSTHVKQNAAQHTRHPPRGTRPKRRALLLGKMVDRMAASRLTNLHLDDIVCCRRVG